MVAEDPMHPSSLHFFPLGEPFLLILVFLAALVLVFMQVGVIGYVYEAMGVHRRYIASLLILSLLGSYVNIPVAELHSEQVVPAQHSLDYPGGAERRAHRRRGQPGRSVGADAPVLVPPLEERVVVTGRRGCRGRIDRRALPSPSRFRDRNRRPRTAGSSR